MELKVNNVLTLDELPKFFISVAILIDREKRPVHSGILIKFDDKVYLCHYPDMNEYPIIEEYSGNNYFFNVIDCFNIKEKDEVKSIYHYLRIVCKQSRMSYGYIIEDSSYKSDGKFDSKLNLGELGTCVSFCLYILNYLNLNNDSNYMNTDDWDDSEVNEEKDIFLRNMLKTLKPNFDEETYLKNRKRIKPLELYTGSFQEGTPIRKSFVDKNKELVLNKILESLN